MKRDEALVRGTTLIDTNIYVTCLNLITEKSGIPLLMNTEIQRLLVSKVQVSAPE